MRISADKSHKNTGEKNNNKKKQDGEEEHGTGAQQPTAQESPTGRRQVGSYRCVLLGGALPVGAGEWPRDDGRRRK